MAVDLGIVKENVAKMEQMGAPEKDIDAYIQSEGATIDAVRAYQPDLKEVAENPVVGALADAGEGFVAGVKNLGTGALQLANELPGGGIAALYRKILPVIAPDVGTELSQLTPNDVQQSAANVARSIENQGEDKGFFYGAGKFTSEILPGMAIAGPVASGAVMGALQPTTQEETGESLAERAQNTAVSAALSKGVSMAAPYAINAVKNLPSTLGRALGVSPQATREMAEAGVAPILPAVGMRGAKAVNATLLEFPYAGEVLQKAARETIRQIDDKVTTIADDLSPAATAEEAGRSIQKGVGEFVGNFKAMSTKLYDKVDSFIPAEKPVPVSNTIDLFRRMNARLASTPTIAKTLSNPKFKEIQKAVEEDAINGAIPYKGLAELRTAVGDMLGDTQLVTDIPRAQLKQLYGALTEDIKQSAAAAGPDALKAYARANNYYKAAIKRIDDVLQPIVDANPEKAFQYATEGTKLGASKFNAIKRSLSPEQVKTLESVMLRRLGMANPGAQNAEGNVFSPTTFLTNWNKLAPTARDSFLATQPALKRSMERLLKASSHMAEVQRMVNHSGSGRVILGGNLLVGSFYWPYFLGAIPVGWGGAKLMTNPKFVEWLARTPNYSTPEGIAKHISRLSALGAASSPDLREGIREMLINLNETGEQ